MIAPPGPNWIVATPPSGDSSNRAASTEFVTIGIAALSETIASAVASAIASAIAPLTPQTGTWTPSFTFSTPGNLTAVYSTQAGQYWRQGNLVNAWFRCTTSAFTHTSASGSFQIAGLPVAMTSNTGFRATGAPLWRTISVSGYTDLVVFADPSQNTSVLYLFASGPGTTVLQLGAAHLTTAVNISIESHIAYLAG